MMFICLLMGYMSHCDIEHFLAKHVPGSIMVGPVIADEELFASEVVTCMGQFIGVVVADTHENAKYAVQYEEVPAILSIKEAIASNSFPPETERCLSAGDVDLCFLPTQCDNIIEREVQVGGQKYFYLEPSSTLVWTIDGGNEVHMISSTHL
ncbi:xylitol dehydrogenase [Orobanche gracilis]